MKNKSEQEGGQPGLATSNLGSIYDNASTKESQATTKADSQSQSDFSQKEKAVRTHPFSQFYSTGEPVQFKTQNRFEGKSNYFHYYPTGHIDEQKLEMVWFEHKNRQL